MPEPLSYIPRSLEPALREAASEFPAVVLTGPRQSGKTTILRHLFGSRYQYVSLDPPDVRALARQDPRSFLAAHAPPVIYDEIQCAPNLLPYVKERIDAQRHVAGQYLLAGSQNLLLAEKVTESLAGRAAMLRLLPLSRREAQGRPNAALPWEAQAEKTEEPDSAETLAFGPLWDCFLRGGYPELRLQPERNAFRWQASYVQTCLERDVRTLRQVGDWLQFQSFLRALAARNAQLLNLAAIARDLGLALNTVKAWLSVLEATYQVMIVRPYFANVGKRLVKTPKAFFTDTGTLCYLAGLQSPEHAVAGPMGGAVMETAVLSEIVRTLTHRGIEPQIYFWRTTAGTEVDFIVDVGRGLAPIEVKLSATPRASMAASIRMFQRDLHGIAMPGYVVHPGDLRLPLGPSVTALPFAEL